ncbi:MAG: DNA polymerase IV [Nitrospirae bacterium]|nr:DNA polymerase IV [Nitrospirota bacterium]
MSTMIICIDMDAFFASVEQQVNPKLRGKPIAVIGSGGRTVVTTRSYEARKFGVKTGMNIYEAKKLCPHLILVVGDNEKYTHTCRELSVIYNRYTPDIEIYSIDEAFLDVTTTHYLFGGPVAIGLSIKKEVKDQFGINCTVGIAPNILMAKLASDIAKPDGLKWIRPEDTERVLKDLPVKELWGIGSATAERLEQFGIRTCGELGRAPVSLLRSKFGIMGETLKHMGLGRCDRPLIVKEEDPKSIGHSMTLPKDISDGEAIKAELLKLSSMVGRRARKHGFVGKKITLTIRYADFKTFTKQATLQAHTNCTHEIYHNALTVLDSISLADKVRLLGVSLSQLMRQNDDQLALFNDDEKERSILRAVDSLNDKFGDFTVTWASYLKTIEPQSVISPAWRPSGVRNLNIKN